MRLVVIERNGEEEFVYFQLACDLLLALWICEGGEMPGSQLESAQKSDL